MRTIVFALIIIGLSFSGVASAQDEPPCGPAGHLSAELSTNVAADSRCFEIRMYTADTARDGGGDYDRAIDELHQRFREKEVEIFENHGAEIVAVWQNLDDPNTLIWMLAYRDRAHRHRGEVNRIGTIEVLVGRLCREGVACQPSSIQIQSPRHDPDGHLLGRGV